VGKGSCGYQDGFPGQRDPDALQHYPEEDDQVPILLDQRRDLVHDLQGATILTFPERSALRELADPLLVGVVFMHSLHHHPATVPCSLP
jgi:hypothetical protein